MKIRILVIGKTAESYLKEGIEIYLNRLSHYCDISFIIVPDVKNAASTDKEKLKEQEGEAFLKQVKKDDYIILLDENGKTFSSVKFASELAKWMHQSHVSPVFVIGGAFGFGKNLTDRSAMKMSLSSLTFSHQMVRLIFAEQLYRAFTIIKREPYHHI